MIVARVDVPLSVEDRCLPTESRSGVRNVCVYAVDSCSSSI
jgi:hypothetical protein